MSQQSPWLDSNDALCSIQSMMPKDLANIPMGVPTHGMWEYVIFLDDLFFNAWMTAAGSGGMGLCYGLLATTMVTRLAFVPFGLYSQIVGHKMKLL